MLNTEKTNTFPLTAKNGTNELHKQAIIQNLSYSLFFMIYYFIFNGFVSINKNAAPKDTIEIPINKNYIIMLNLS